MTRVSVFYEREFVPIDPLALLKCTVAQHSIVDHDQEGFFKKWTGQDTPPSYLGPAKLNLNMEISLKNLTFLPNVQMLVGGRAYE